MVYNQGSNGNQGTHGTLPCIDDPFLFLTPSPPPPQSGWYEIKFRLPQILLNAGLASDLVMMSAT
jgi:hypothetical protein